MATAANETSSILQEKRRRAAVQAQITRGAAGRLAAAAKALHTRRENEAAFGELVDVSGARCILCGEVGGHECKPLIAARALVESRATMAPALAAWGRLWVDFCAGANGAERPSRMGPGLNPAVVRALELQLAREFGLADPDGFVTGDDLQRLRRRSARRGPVQAVPDSLYHYKHGYNPGYGA